MSVNTLEPVLDPVGPLGADERSAADSWSDAVLAAAEAEGRVFGYYRSLAEMLVDWASEVVRDWVRARESFSRVITHLLADREKKIRDRVRRGALDHVDAMAREDVELLTRLTAIGYEFRPRLSREVASDPARIALPTLAERCSEYVATLALKVQAEPLENGHVEKIESALAVLHRAIAMIEKTIATRPLTKSAETAA
jgi:hypothetical protein